MAQKTSPKAPDNKKKIILGAVVVIVLLNIMWTIMQNKFDPKLNSIKTEVAGISQRLTSIEEGGLPQVATLKSDFDELRAVSDKLAERLKKVLKAEEDQLASLEAQVEAQRARVEELRKLAAD